MYSYEQYIGDQEAANDAACMSAAEHEGLTSVQAELCDNGEWRCTHCPWKHLNEE